MDKFKDRLEVQKIPYLAQAYGIDLGYSFSWYLKGPYSRSVAKDGFTICDILNEGQRPTIQEGLRNERINEFKEMIKPHMNDPTWLEIAASIVYLRKEQYGREKLDQIIGRLIGDMTYGYKNFAESEVKAVLADLKRMRLLS